MYLQRLAIVISLRAQGNCDAGFFLRTKREHGTIAINVQFQSAYRQDHFTETALIKVHNDILCAVDRGCVVVLVMLDLTAAFETLNHAVLLSRLFHIFGVTGAAFEWFRSYLSGRHQVVRIGNEKSPPKDVTFGVPQGSVLGPLLFTVFTVYLLKRQSPGRTRSSEQHLLDIPRTKLASFGDWSFRVVGPRLWNALPIDIKCCGTLSAFRKALKTHIFKAYYC